MLIKLFLPDKAERCAVLFQAQQKTKFLSLSSRHTKETVSLYVAHTEKQKGRGEKPKPEFVNRNVVFINYNQNKINQLNRFSIESMNIKNPLKGINSFKYMIAEMTKNSILLE